MNARVTVITASNPSRLTKKYVLRDGELAKEEGGALVEGQANIQEFSGPCEFRKLLVGLSENQALTYGLPKVANIRVLSKKKWHEEGRPADAIPLLIPSAISLLLLIIDGKSAFASFTIMPKSSA